MRALDISLTLGLPALMLFTSAVAQAAAPPNEGIHQGGFIYGSPGGLAVPLDDDATRAYDVGYQWGMGGGYLWEPVRHFMITAGGSFEHSILNIDNDWDGFGDFHGSLFRFLPEARIGGGTRKVWGYGLLSPGLVVGHWRWDAPAGFDDSDSDVGFDLGVGGGVQGIVWANLFLGGEVGADIMFFDDNGNGVGDNSFSYLDVKFLIGWYF